MSEFSLGKKILIGIFIAVIIVFLIDALIPKQKTVCYEYKTDNDSEAVASEVGSSVDDEDNEYADFDQDTEVVCHYRGSSSYNNYYWHSTYISSGRSYMQGNEISPTETSKYDNVNDLEQVENSKSVEKSGNSTSASDASKSSSKGSTSKSTSTSSGGKSSSTNSGGKSSSTSIGGKSSGGHSSSS